jgi:hypothetical protein
MKELGKIVTNQYGAEKTVYGLPNAHVIPEDHTIVTPDKKRIEISWRTNFDRMRETSNSWKELYPYQDETHVDATSLMESEFAPFGVWWASDMHIGNVDTDLDTLQRHIELIENTKNCGLVTMGDDIDLGILPKLEVRFMQTMNPLGQAFTASDLMDEFNGRNPRNKQIILAHLIGNHTHTMMQTTGILYEKFYEKSKAALLPSIGEMFLHVGQQDYEIALAHKYWGRSKINISLETKRLMEYAYPDADVAVVGDFHVKGHEEFKKGGKWRTGIRPGTYRVGGLFELNRGWGKGQLGGSFTVFYPDQHKTLTFDVLEDGISYMNTVQAMHE